MERTSSIGRVRRDVVNWKGWKGRRISDVVAGRDVVNWKGWKGRGIRTIGRERTLLMEGTDQDVVNGRDGDR